MKMFADKTISTAVLIGCMTKRIALPLCPAQQMGSGRARDENCLDAQTAGAIAVVAFFVVTRIEALIEVPNAGLGGS
jgi:hypothetical protein